MRCCTDSLLRVWSLAGPAFLLLAGGLELCPAAPGGSAATTQPATEELDWAQMARELGRPATRTKTLDELRTVQPFPANAWVSLLEHEELAVRLGALEVLEDLAGSDLDYDPWELDARARTEALLRWRTWAASGAARGAYVAAQATLQPEQLREYLQDLLRGESEKSERAFVRLRQYPAQAIGEIERFLGQTDPVVEGARARLKTAQYRLLLDTAGMKDAARNARLLVFGNRDERVEGIESLSQVGTRSVPILREMLGDADALVRERAVDVLLASGSKTSLEVIEARMKAEKDENVIHAAIRGLGKVEHPISTRLLAGYLSQPSEDLVAAALLSLSLQRSTANGVRVQIGECLKHPSWRVRAAALQCITKASIGALGDQALLLLDDSDSFVRQAAVHAIAITANASGSDSHGRSSQTTKRQEAAMEALCRAFERDDELKGAVLKAFPAMKQPVPDRLLAQFSKLPPGLLAFGIGSLDTDRPPEMALLLQFAKSDDPEVACAALRMLARGRPLSHPTEPLLVEILTSGDLARKEAVLDNLNTYRRDKTTSRTALDQAYEELTGESALASAAAASSQAVKTPSLADALYEAFLGSGTAPPPRKASSPADQLYEAFLGTNPPALQGAPPGTRSEGAEAVPASLEAVLDQIASRASSPVGSDATQAVLAAQRMLQLGFAGGPRHYLRWWAELDVQQRSELAESLTRNPQPASLALWSRLMRDPSQEIRRKAVEAATDDNEQLPLIKLAFWELGRADAVLQAAEVYSSNLESLVDDETPRAVVELARKLVTDARADRQVLGLIMLRNSGAAADDELVLKATKSPYLWVRRAAVRTLGMRNREALATEASTLSGDPSAWVREGVAATWSRDFWPWKHHFNDNTALEDAGASYVRRDRRSSNRPLDEAVVTTLRRLAEDHEERIRLAAMLALLAGREEVQLPTLISLLDKAHNRDEIAKHLADFVEIHYARLGQGLAPLLDRMNWQYVSINNVELIRRHFGMTEATAKDDFAAYAKESGANASAPAKAPEPQFLAVSAEPRELPEADHSTSPVTLVFFHSPGCPECEKVRRELEALSRRYTGMKVLEQNIRDPESVLLNEALSQRFAIPPPRRLLTPSVFLQTGALIKDEVTRGALVQAIEEVTSVGETDAWHQTKSEDLTVARQQVEQRYQSLHLGVIFLFGLLDGVNPCAFATIIFLLSYLQVARRTPREMLAVGLTFISGVFLTYFVLGLGLVEVVTRLTALQTIGRIVNWALALGCLVVAVLSLRDARLARAGRLQEMSLQLPGFLKDRIRGVIRTGTRMNRFVLAAFAAGVVISVLELACTGQVYLPTIVYAMKTGAAHATGFLLVYNVAFITPLVIVFALAWGGMRSEALVRFQQQHTATVKYAMAVLFAVLFIVLVRSGRV